MKHTQGEWRYFFNDCYFEVIGEGDVIKPNISIFTISREVHPDFDEKNICEKDEAEANAKLIAASPDLLRECENALSYLNSFKNEWKEGEESLAYMLDVVIKKATE